MSRQRAEGKRQRAGSRVASGVWVIGVMLSSLLVACPGERPEYRLGGVLPSPVTPGDSVTAFGLLPKEVALSFDSVPITGIRVSNGVQFNVPVDALAGDHALEVTGDGARLNGVVSVMPRLDAVALQGNALQLRGAGWAASGDLEATSVVVDGVRLTPTRDDAGLRVVLPTRGVYGTMRVAVQVGERLSEAKGLRLEAGAVRGRAVFPVSSASPLKMRPPRRGESPSRALIVRAAPQQLVFICVEGDATRLCFECCG
jgi:hypothetical protein